MLRKYFGQLRGLWTGPSRFFEGNFPEDPADKEAFWFAFLTGLFVALEVGLSEALSGGSLSMVAYVTVLMLILVPFLLVLSVVLWAFFVRLCGQLLGVDLPLAPLRRVTAYSTGGLAAVGAGFGLGKWFSLAVVLFQVLGLEKLLGCSRWTAGVYVGLPFSLVGVLLAFFTFMFQVFK